jgi:phosphatidylglycerol:prolipoprotein diacylglycerol transferase
MWPLVEIAGYYFPTYNFALILGILFALLVLILAGRRKRISLHFLTDHFVLSLIVTLFVGRLFKIWLHDYPFIAFSSSDFPYLSFPGGFDLYGLLVGFLIILGILCYRYNEKYLQWLDLSMLPITILLILHFGGTFLSGGSYGKPTTLPWGVVFNNPDSLATLSTLPIHPTQIYYALATLVLFLLAIFLFKRTKEFGKVGSFLLLTLSLAYFLIDFLRGDSAPTFGLLRTSQYIEIFLIAFAAAIVIKLKYSQHLARSGELHIH